MARKSKAFGKLLYQSQQAKGQQDSMDQLANRVKKNLAGKVADVVVNPAGEVKMSEVLEDFVEPYLDMTTSRDQRLKLLAIAVFAWNLTLMPEDQQQQELDKIVTELAKGQGRQMKQDIREILEEMMERKRQFFAQHQRYILDFELRERRNDFHLSVVSSLLPQNSEEDSA
jgi:hypothetical protein